MSVSTVSFLTSPTLIPPVARYAVVGLCLLWLLAGTVGHDPWKLDDAIHLAIAHEMSWQHWLVPRIIGEPMLASPPLYHWTAALCGQVFGGLLPWHDAARLATTLYAGIVLLCLAFAAKKLISQSAALAAPLLAIGTLGLLVPMHDALPNIAGLTGFAMTLLGLCEWKARPERSGLLCGAGLLIAFMSSGLDGLLPPLLVLMVCLVHPEWRNTSALRPLLITASLALAGLIWPWLLHQHAPELFAQWWQAELDSLAPRQGFSRDHLELLVWASWPTLPLACWALWLERRRLKQTPSFLPLLAASISLLVFFASPPKPGFLLPALAPLALLAANGAGRLRRGAANAFDWFGMMTMTLVAGLIWLGWIAMITGEPARVAKNFSKPAPDFIAEVSVFATLLAIAASVAWIAVMVRTPRSPWRACARWSVGITAIWLLLTSLWMPWIDHGKSYRTASHRIHQALRAATGTRTAPACIAREGLGIVQRAALDYFDGIRTVDDERGASCDFLIVQTTPGTPRDRSGWNLLLETSRPGDKTERLRIYRRAA